MNGLLDLTVVFPSLVPERQTVIYYINAPTLFYYPFISH
jgi:hypothetical protein